MNILYAYRYGIVGGVSTQLLLRQKALAEQGISCHLFFCGDHGLKKVSPVCSNVHFGEDISLGKLIKRIKPDVSVVVDSPELLNSASGTFLNRVPVYLDVHTTTQYGLAYLSQLSVRKIQGVFVPTDYSSRLVSERVPSIRPMVVPNLIDTYTFSDAEIDRSCSESVREFVWVGKLDYHKNWHLAVVYTKLLKEIFGNVKMTLVGGYTASELKARELFNLIDRLGLSEQITWIDRMSNSDLAEIYRRCALSKGAMLITSRDESFGMAAAEALLCGCPLITNKIPVFDEVFPDSALIMKVDIWEPEQVAEAAIKLADADLERDISEMRDHLTLNYGDKSFVSAFGAAIGMST